jgi:hypothetical protein
MGEKRKEKRGEREKVVVKMERRKKKINKKWPVKIFLFNEELQ